MPLTGTQLADAIRAYPGHYGDAWAVFWDYKCEVERDGQSLLNAEHLQRTADELFNYLLSFGMGRGSTRLRTITIGQFTDVLHHIQPESFAALQAVKFEQVERTHGEAVHAVWRQLVVGLAKYHVSHTDTMITKILMGLWGEAPAFDRFFKQTYSRAFGHWRMHTMRVLVELRDEYRRSWKPALDALEDEFTHTRRGQHNRIPVARLIDMGFWYLGLKNWAG